MHGFQRAAKIATPSAEIHVVLLWHQFVHLVKRLRHGQVTVHEEAENAPIEHDGDVQQFTVPSVERGDVVLLCVSGKVSVSDTAGSRKQDSVPVSKSTVRLGHRLGRGQREDCISPAGLVAQANLKRCRGGTTRATDREPHDVLLLEDCPTRIWDEPCFQRERRQNVG